MKKILLKESQAKKLMSRVINEQSGGKYQQDVKCDVQYHNLTHKGGEIDWITDPTFTVTFDIDMTYGRYGISDIMVHNIKGPDEIELNLTYYPEGSEDSVEDMIILRPDWSNVEIENNADIDWIGIDQYPLIELANDNEGNLVIRKMEFYTKSI